MRQQGRTAEGAAAVEEGTAGAREERRARRARRARREEKEGEMPHLELLKLKIVPKDGSRKSLWEDLRWRIRKFKRELLVLLLLLLAAGP
eukprot:764658-Hanusia_phi.AAC.17